VNELCRARGVWRKKAGWDEVLSLNWAFVWAHQLLNKTLNPFRQIAARNTKSPRLQAREKILILEQVNQCLPSKIRNCI
jgi:hypothetical protein